MHLSDRSTGGFLVVLGALAFWGGSRLPGVPGQDIGPAVFPMVIGAALVLCGTLIALGIGRSFEEPDPEPEEAHAGLALWLGRWRVLAALVPPALLVFYALAASLFAVWLWMRGLQAVPVWQADQKADEARDEVIEMECEEKDEGGRMRDEDDA
jgi:hypothetical protein